jgi:hypothetical protein
MWCHALSITIMVMDHTIIIMITDDADNYNYYSQVVPREKSDDRPLSKVARIRNIMLREAKVP